MTSEQRTLRASRQPANHRQLFDVFERFALIPEDSHDCVGRGWL